jgi:hypothetical protein
MALRPVYSVLLYSSPGLIGTAGWTTVTGAVTVVRDIEAYEMTSKSGALLALGAPGGGTLVVWQAGGTFPTSKFQWQGRIVLPQNFFFGLNAISGTWTVIISGYELPTP